MMWLVLAFVIVVCSLWAAVYFNTPDGYGFTSKFKWRK